MVPPESIWMHLVCSRQANEIWFIYQSPRFTQHPDVSPLPPFRGASCNFPMVGWAVPSWVSTAKTTLAPIVVGSRAHGFWQAKLKDCKTHQSWVLDSQKLLAIPTLRQPLPRILQNNFLLNLPKFDQVVRGGSVKMHCCRKLLKHQFVHWLVQYSKSSKNGKSPSQAGLRVIVPADILSNWIFVWCFVHSQNDWKVVYHPNRGETCSEIDGNSFH